METVLADLQIFKYSYLNGKKCESLNTIFIMKSQEIQEHFDR